MPEKLPPGVVVPQELVDAGVKLAMEKGHSPQIVSDYIEFQVQNAAAELAKVDNDSFTLVEAAKAQISSQVGPQNFETTVADAKSVSEILGLNVEENTLVTNPNLVITLARLKEKDA